MLTDEDLKKIDEIVSRRVGSGCLEFILLVLILLAVL